MSQKADNGEGEDGNVPTEGDLLWKALGESSPEPKKDERDDKSEDDYERQKMNLSKKIQIKQELIRGGSVQPTIACYPGESYIDNPEFYQYLNKGMCGNFISA